MNAEQQEMIDFITREMHKVIIEIMHSHALWDDENVYPLVKGMQRLEHFIEACNNDGGCRAWSELHGK